MSDKDIKKIAIYTRVSTDEQARSGLSLDAQLERLRSYCLARDWEIVGEYVDPGFSGRNIRRPQYTKMFEDIKKWDGILVMKMDRIHRNRLNFIGMMEDLGKKDKQFISMNESLDTSTAMGRFVMGIIQDIAQLESEQIGERVAIAMVQKAKKAEKFIGHRTAFGYTWNKDNESFIPDPKKLEIVKQAFQMYLDGFSMREIGVKLNKSNTTIRYYLHNCFYTGYERYMHYFRKVEGLDPVVSVEDFNKVQLLFHKKVHNYQIGKGKKNTRGPMCIQDGSNYKLDKEVVKRIPIINRAKHNYNF